MRVTLTGRIAVEANGRLATEARLGGRRGRIAFVLLVGQRGVGVPREELAEAFWPSGLPATWESSLRGAISKVRAMLAEVGLDDAGTLSFAFGCYQLNLPAGVVVDVERASEEAGQAERALAAGDRPRAAELADAAILTASRPLLAGEDADWLDRRRDEMRAMLVRALEVRSACRSQAGDHAGAVAAAEGALVHEPFRESAFRALMRAHITAGNRAEALRAYERCRTLLVDELGADPSPETSALHLEILQEDAAGHYAQPPRTIPAPLDAHGGLGFVGREAELAVLSGAWRAAAGGRRSLVLVRGESGIGKTHLCAELARRVAGDGGVVLYGRADAELAVPYKPFVEALDGYVGQCPPESLPARLGPSAGELLRAAPWLRDRLPGIGEPSRADPESERYLLFEGVTGWLKSTARAEPVLLVLDDLQWARRPTMLLLRHLTQSTASARLCIVAAYRDELEGSSESDLFADLVRTPGADHVALTGLSLQEVGRLVERADRLAARGSAAFAEAVHSETSGNPFFVGEVLRHLAEVDTVPGVEKRLEIPPSVRELVARRLARLEPATRDVLRAAAVAGFEFEIALLADALGTDELTVLDAIDVARSAGIVGSGRARADMCAFSHAIVRSTIYDDVTPARRMRLHLEIARSLHGRADAEHRLAELAGHYLEAAPLGEAEVAVETARRAGDDALSRLAFEEAAALYERALEVHAAAHAPDPGVECDLRIAEGDALNRAGDASHRGVLLEAAAVARSLGDARRLGQVAAAINKRGVSSSALVDAELVGILEDALLGLADDDDDLALRARLTALLVAELGYSADVSARKQELRRAAVDTARRSGDDGALAFVLIAVHKATSSPDNLHGRIEETTELVRLARGKRDAIVELRALAFLFDALVERGDIDAADEALERAEELAAALGQYHPWEVAHRRAGRVLLSGDLDEAEELSREVYRMARRTGVQQTMALGVLGVQMFAIRMEHGSLEEVAAFAEADGQRFPARLAYLRARVGSSDGARALLDAAAATDFAPHARGVDWLESMVLFARVAHDLSEAAAARKVYGLLVPYAGRFAAASAATQGPVDLALALAAATAGNFVDAGRHFADAAELCRRTGAAGWLARTRCEWAAMLHESDGSSAARVAELGGQVLVSAEELGMTEVASAARRLVPA